MIVYKKFQLLHQCIFSSIYDCQKAHK